MARMIPPYCSEKCISPGERALFAKFRDDPATKDWIVLHSLALAKHSTRAQGEVDFVVLVPNEGILCLEVKAGEVDRKEGLWIYGGVDKSAVGPFVQASEGMHEVKKYLSSKNPALKPLLYFSGVFFTKISFDIQSTEWHPWQFADKGTLSAVPVSECCLRILRRAHKYLSETPSAKWYDKKWSRPGPDEVKEIATLLRGNFECPVPPDYENKLREQEILRFTEEQYAALDLLDENDRVVFKGPAGTGKTFLALEAARRSVARGNRTLLACYNRLLGGWIGDRTKQFADAHYGHLDCGTFHRILLNLSGKRVPKKADGNFWKVELPECVMERALSGEIKTPLWDMVILDEAQDLVCDTYFDVLDLLLEGGMAGGKWAFFGDFEKQAIYSDAVSENHQAVLLEIIRRRAPSHSKYPLRINCRNPRKVAEGIQMVSNLRPGYSRVLASDDFGDMEIKYYKDNNEQKTQLYNLLKQVSKQFPLKDISVLSLRDDKTSCAARIRIQADPPLVQAKIGEKENAVRFTTVHSFKGLEASAIILTDIDCISGIQHESLLYIGMSRAKHRLWLLMNEKCRKTYLEKLEQSYLS